jgi:hypothetical protein
VAVVPELERLQRRVGARAAARRSSKQGKPSGGEEGDYLIRGRVGLIFDGFMDSLTSFFGVMATPSPSEVAAVAEAALAKAVEPSVLRCVQEVEAMSSGGANDQVKQLRKTVEAAAAFAVRQAREHRRRRTKRRRRSSSADFAITLSITPSTSEEEFNSDGRCGDTDDDSERASFHRHLEYSERVDAEVAMLEDETREKKSADTTTTTTTNNNNNNNNNRAWLAAVRRELHEPSLRMRAGKVVDEDSVVLRAVAAALQADGNNGDDGDDGNDNDGGDGSCDGDHAAQFPCHISTDKDPPVAQTPTGQLHVACSARCNLRPLKKNRFYFFV